MALETHTAKRKDHRCTACGRRIPKGARYFRDADDSGNETLREHTNCEAFKHESHLPLGYNQNRGEACF